MEKQRYFFIGIGGIGMSALARYFLANGCAVGGYDKTRSDLTRSLEKEGMMVVYEDDKNVIPQEFRTVNDSLLVVRTPAVPINSAITQYYSEAGAEIKKRSEVLSAIAASKQCIAVAGTHGKTTTSSILGHILHRSSLGCTAFVGGILTGYEANVLIDPDSPYVVLEADEFDRSFHHLDPRWAIVTSTDADHLDIYGSGEQFISAFEEFIAKVSVSVFTHRSVPADIKNEKTLDYGIDEGHIQAKNIRVHDGRFHFDIVAKEWTFSDASISLPGRHNVLNCMAAIAICKAVGVGESEIRSGLVSYRGVKRRFEYMANEVDIVFIDDYAHHPTEIEACISSVRELYPEKKLTLAFQPHLYSRTRDFMPGFAKSLSMADELILLPIYPAREEPIEGVTSEVLLQQISVTNKVLCEKEELPSLIATRELEVLLTLGAGDIDREIPRIQDLLKKRLKPKQS